MKDCQSDNAVITHLRIPLVEEFEDKLAKSSAMVTRSKISIAVISMGIVLDFLTG
jgi:hypothetical protein